MAYHNKWRCPRCGYTADREVMTEEARLYYEELKPDIKNLIQHLFKLVNKHVYSGAMNKMDKSKFLYTIGGTKDLKDVIHGIRIYINDKMYLKGLPLTYLSAIIKNRAERKEVMLEAEKRIRGIDPPKD